jgi:mono/diheme cytochrome c family protein
MKALIGVALVIIAMIGMAQGKKQASGRFSGNTEHGKYLVQNVAQCVQCHTPRDEKGGLLNDRLLTGAPIPLRSPFLNQQWAFHAPRIAGMPGYSEEEGVRLLTDGIARNGQIPKMPMPQFRMSSQDARDVVAYLKSLE